MNAKTITLSVLFLFSLNLLALRTQPNNTKAPVNRQFGPAVTDVFFDLDDVLLDRPNVSKIVRKRWKTIIPSLFNVKFLFRMRKLSKNAPAEEYRALLAKYGYKKLAAMVDEIRFNKTINQGTAAIIQELKKQGYTLHIATNMGVSDLHYYTNECKETKEIFALFDKKKAVDFKNTPVKKPDPAYFEDAFENFSSGKKYRVFTDDKKRNVKAFESVGDKHAKGIRFKSPKQLAREFKDLNMLPTDFELPTLIVA